MRFCGSSFRHFIAMNPASHPSFFCRISRCLAVVFALTLWLQASSAWAAPPGAPTFGATTLYEIWPSYVWKVKVDVTAPAGTTGLKLQKKLSFDNDSAFADVATGIGNGQTFNVDSLTPATNYSFRYVNGAGENGIAASIALPNAPPNRALDFPAVRYGNITTSEIDVAMPALPQGATTLTLQWREWLNGTVSTFSNAATNLEGGGMVHLTFPNPISPVAARAYQFRVISVGPHGSTPNLGDNEDFGSDYIAVPHAPTVQTGSVSSSGFVMNAEEGYSSWVSLTSGLALQKKKLGQPDSAFETVVVTPYGYTEYLNNGGAPTTVTNLAPSTTYVFRRVAPSAYQGTAIGATITVSTTAGSNPSEPASPIYSLITPFSVRVQAPAAYNGASKFALQRKVGDVWQDVTGANNVSTNGYFTVSGLRPLQTYSFRWLGVPSNTALSSTASPLSSVTTIQIETPQISNPTQTTVSVLMPDYPDRQMTLQWKETTQTWNDVAGIPANNIVPTAAANASFTVSSLPVGKWLEFRWKAKLVGGTDEDFGPVSAISTTAPAPGQPSAPVVAVGTYDPNSPYDWPFIGVNNPALTTNATSLTLQVYAVGQTGALWTDIPVTFPVPGVGTVALYGFTSGASYRFRFVAYGPGGSTTGVQTSTDLVIPSAVTAWNTANTLGTAIQCDGIRPIDLAEDYQNGKLRLSSFLAVDWDERAITLGNGQVIRIRQDDPCIYYWNVRAGTATSGATVGSYVDGANRAQSVQWIPPSSGQYTIALTVTDQEGLNKAPTDGGTRDDANRGTWDAPLIFKKTITIP